MAIVFFQRLEVALDSTDVRFSDEHLLRDLELCSLLVGLHAQKIVLPRAFLFSIIRFWPYCSAIMEHTSD